MTLDAEFERINAIFHDTYGASRANAQKRAPLLVLLGPELILLVDEQRTARSLLLPLAEHIKAGAHACVAAYVLLNESNGQSLTGSKLRRLEAMSERLSSLVQQLPTEGEAPELRDLLQNCAELVSRSKSRRSCAREEADGFAEQSGAIIERLTDLATRAQIDRLHSATNAILQTLSDEQKSALRVIVAGDHQARRRSLGMQYFKKRMGESGNSEERVTYGENVSSEEQALALLGTRELDAAIARAFFKDPKRLERDILGDSAERCLAHFELTKP